MNAVGDWPRIKALFQSAIDLEPGHRRGFVLEAAGEDVALRDAVLKMLALDEAPQGLLDRGAREIVTTPCAAPALPESVGPYRPQRVLGRGGMGVVLLATRHDGEFAQQVAIKLIRGGSFDAGLVLRFRREREILARLSHPHIARLTDGGVTDDGSPWYAMEYIDGESLVAWCDARALNLRERVRLFLQVLDAIDYAHRNLVVHRDLKPSNILVTGAAPGHVKLLDFGIAKLLDEAEGNALTGSDTRLLTPDYAAPEQILGQPVSTQTDVYALGVLLFELLTGRLPYRSAGSGPRVAAAIVDEAPERLRQAISRQTAPGDTRAQALEELARRRGLAPTKLRAALDRDLEQVVALALAKRPDERYPSAAAMADDLRAWLDGHPLRSRPVPWPRRASKFVQRHRFGVAASLALLLVACAGIAATIDQTRRAQREAETAQAVRRTLTEVLSAADPSSNGGVEPTLREVLDLGIERIQRDTELPVEVRTPLLSDLGEVYAGLGEYVRAGEVFGQARDLDPFALSDANELARLNSRLAETETELSRFDSAEAALAQARARLAESAQPDPVLAVEIELAAARVEQGRGEPMRAVSRLEALIARLERARPEQLRELALALGALGSMQLARGESSEGVALMRKALEQQREAGAGELELSSAQVELARAMRDDAKAADAAALMREALEVQRRLLGDDHPRTLTTRGEHAILLFAIYAYDEAERDYLETIAGTRRRFGESHPRVAFPINNYGVALYGLRRYAEAAEQFAQAYEIWREHLGAGHEHTLQARGNLAGAWTELGRLDEASEALEALVAARRERAEPTLLRSALLTRGLLRERMERLSEARADYSEALALGRAEAPDTQAQWAWAQVLLGRASRRLGDEDAALELLEDAAAHYRLPVYQGGSPRTSVALLELARTLEQLGREPARQLELARKSLEIRRAKLGEEHADTREARLEVERFLAREGASPATAENAPR
jgi:serine/threonine protein kinase